MWSVEVVELFPDSQFLLEIHVTPVREQLIELIFVGSVGPLDLAVLLRRARFDVDVPHPQVSHVPVEQGLELVAAVGSDRADPERELLHHVVDEVDGVCLRVAAVDLACRTRVASSMAVYW